ncbi:MAG: HD-GYP domain-containing protein [Phycisphaerales bacterium]|nr:HD-GYP domain-containing protein [Phycisphaerales bacterium]
MPKRIDEDRLESGMCLPGALRNHAGQVLLPAGVYLKEYDLPRLRAYAVNGLFGDRDWPDEYTHAPTEDGATPYAARRNPTRSPLDADSLITSNFLHGIHDQRSFARRLASPARGTPNNPAASKGPDPLQERLIPEILKTRPFQPLKADRRPRVDSQSLQAEVERGLRAYSRALCALRNIYSDLVALKPVSLITLRNVVIEFLDAVMLDFDWLPNLLSRPKPAEEDYLPEQALKVSLLSMAVAAQLGLSRRAILEVALGALLHDAGMSRVPPTIRLAPRTLTDLEWRMIHAHPDHTIQLLENITELSDAARLVAWQTHERGDTTGYPRHLPQTRIHPYARIVAVADTYAAMISPRPYRPARSPYQAAEILLRDSRNKYFDIIVVRALLDCISLFPVGSVIELDDGRTARVVRANTGLPTRPIIALMDARNRPEGSLIDLAAEIQRRVIRVIQ